MRRSQAWSRRVAWVATLAVLLTVAAPDDVVPAGNGGGFPMAGLLRLVTTAGAWSAAPPRWDPETPQQRRGGPVEGGHDVTAEETRADVDPAQARARGAEKKPRGKGKGELDEYRPERDPQAEVKTTPARGAFDPATSRKDPLRSSESVDYYVNADGSVTTVLSSGRANFKNAKGEWQTIDTRLVTRAGHGRDPKELRWESTANDVVVSLAAAGDTSGEGVSNGNGRGRQPDGGLGDGVRQGSWSELASVTLPSGAVLSYTLAGARTVVPTVSGSTARYPEVFPGVDLEIVAIPNGLKENLVLHSADAGSSWVFPLRLQGLSASVADDGSVLLVDESGAAVAQIPAGQMRDSRFDPQLGDFTTSTAVRYELIEIDGGPALRVNVDEAWLRDKDRVFPVYVDPNVTLHTYVDDVFINNYTGGPVRDGDNLPVGTAGDCCGTDGGLRKRRSFIRFPSDGDLANKNITGVTLRLHHTWSYDCGHHLPVIAYNVTSSWTVSGLSSLPASSYPGPSLGFQVGRLEINDNYPACLNTGSDRSIGADRDMVIDTSLVQGWMTGQIPKNGIALVASETDPYAWKRFTSANYSASLGPRLIVTYNDNVVPQLHKMYPAANATVNTLTPELHATATDPDNAPRPLRYSFWIKDEASDVEKAHVEWIDNRYWRVPDGLLEWGKSYLWKVAAYDGYESSAETAWRRLTVQPPQPPVTGSLSQNSDKRGFEPAIGNYTMSALDLRVETVGPPLAIERFYNSRDPRITGVFGQGWSSLLDAKVVEHTSGNEVDWVTITYPTGQEVTFGRQTDGTFLPPLGRFATFEAITSGSTVTGYRLIDKNGTTLEFSKSLGSGRYGITKETDSRGRELTLTYDGNDLVTTITSQASQRSLALTWTTPDGTTAPRIASVTTDPAVGSDPSSVSVWTYGYTGNNLTSVCPPLDTEACTAYTYGSVSQYPAVLAGSRPYAYLRLAEPTGATEVNNAILETPEPVLGTPTDVTFGQSGPLAGSTATAAGFNGTSSRIELSSAILGLGLSEQSIALWFKTTSSGPLYGEATQPYGSSTTPWSIAPPLYVGTDGKLRGGFPTVPQAAAIVGLASKCLDNYYGSTTNGNPIYLHSCNPNPDSQYWTHMPDGTVRIAGKCLDVVGAGTANGTKVQLFECSGGASQRWEFVNGAVRNTASGRCLDVPGGNSGDAAVQLQIYDCNGGSSQAWTSSQPAAPITSSGTVNDGEWHLAVLTSAGDTQTLYLDDQTVGSKSGAIAHPTPAYSTIGAGYASLEFPMQGSTKGWQSFDGSIAEVAMFDRPLTSAEVAVLRDARITAGRPLTQHTRPSGVVAASIAYDGATGLVQSVTDVNGGTWTIGVPRRSGSDLEYVSAVLGANPSNYWRLADEALESPGQVAVNEVNGHDAEFDSVALGVPGPFSGLSTNPPTAVEFDGTSSAIYADGAVVDTTSPFAVSTWVKLDSLTNDQDIVVMPGENGSEAFKLTYSSTGHRWIVAMAVRDGTGTVVWQPEAQSAVDSAAAGVWTHLAVSVDTDEQEITIYVNGAVSGTPATASLAFDNHATELILGYGGGNARLKGVLAEFATYRHVLSGADVSALHVAYNNSEGVPVKTVTVTDPMSAEGRYVYDLAAGGRLVAQMDMRGNWTQYGYDVQGFLHLVTDPNGNTTVTGHDPRGNVTSYSNCMIRSDDWCPTIYIEYFLNATDPLDPRNDQVTVIRDGRSYHPEDDNYATRYEYDEYGDLISETDELWRETVTTYTDGTDGIPAGLPLAVRGPDGVTEISEYATNGDLVAMVDGNGRRVEFTRDGLGRITQIKDITDAYPSGRITTYTYDKLGRLLSQTDPAVQDRVAGTWHQAETTYTYDDDGRQTSVTVSDLTVGGDSPRTVSRTYNSHGQVASTIDALGEETTYTYTVYGDVATRTTPDGVTTEYEYDPVGNLLTITVLDYTGHPSDPQPATDLVVESRAYDPAGRLATVTDAMGWETEYQYFDNNLLWRVGRYDPSTDDWFVVEEYWYDGAGNIVWTGTNDGKTWTFADVDAAGRVVTQTLDPDDPGRGRDGVERTTTYTYDERDRITSYAISDGSGPAQIVDRLLDRNGGLLAETQYPSTSVEAPVGRWKLDETTGTTAADASGNSTATLSGTGATWSTSHGGSLELTGDAYFETAGPVLDTSRGFTVAAWVNLDANAGWSTVVAQDGTVHSAFLLGYDADRDVWTFGRCPADGEGDCGAAAMSEDSPSTGTWTHLVGVYDTEWNEVVLYVNGQLEDVQSTSSYWRPALGPLTIGAGKWEGQRSDLFQGLIDDVQVYQRAFGGDEVQAIYQGTAPGNATVMRTSWSLDQRGLPVSQTDADGDVTYFDYDEADRLAVTTFPAVTIELGDGSSPVVAPVVESAAYNTFGEVVESWDANGNHTFGEFNDAGQLTKVWQPSYTAPGSSTPIESITRTFYDEMGRVERIQNALGHNTYYGYDQLGNATTMTAADGGVTTWYYNLVGDILAIVDPLDAERTATYDYLGRPLTQSDVIRQTSEINTTTYTYGDGGWLASRTEPGRAPTTVTYNNVGEPVSVTDGAGNVVHYGYDFAGRQVSIAAQHTSCEPCADRTLRVTAYDGAGRPVSSSRYDANDVLLTQQSVEYSRDSLPLSITNPRGHKTTFGYDALGRLTSMVEPVSATESITTSFGYDATGAQTRFTDGRGNSFLTSYNSWGLPETRTEPGGVTFTTIYDAAGRPVTELLPGGVSTTSTYDVMGRVTLMTGSGAEVATTNRTFGYDLAGRLTSLSGPGGTNTLSYDDRGLLTSVSGPSGNSSYTYTADRLLETRTDAAGVTEYDYDSIGRPIEVSNSTTGLDVTYGYDTQSRVNLITHGGGNKRTLTYDALGRIDTDELTTSADALVGRIRYEWDANSNLTKKTTVGFSGSSVNTYTYDYADRLLSWNNGSTTEDYEYDESGNRTKVGSTTFTYNARNQLVSSSDGTTYTYTPRGTLAGTTSGTVTLPTESDAFGQVIRSYSTETVYSEYTYDGLGRMLRSGFEYTGLGNDLAADPTGTYVRGPGGELIGVNDTYAWTDLHDDVVGQFEASDTALSGSATYSPFGKVLASSGMQGSLGFQSGYTDDLTGKVNMLTRWYNPETGQFDSRDSATVSPVPSSGSANRYAYAGGNPLTRVDPTGQDWMSGCNSPLKCIVQGFVNSFDVVGMLSGLWNFIQNPGAVISSAYDYLKSQAGMWKTRIRNMLPNGLCNAVQSAATVFYAWALLWGGLPDLCGGFALIAGWACALSGVCDIFSDCISAIDDSAAANRCGEAIGQVLADALVGLFTAGASAVARRVAGRISDLIKKFDLNKKNKSDKDNSYKDDVDDIKKNKNKDNDKGNGNGKSNNGGSGSGSGSSGGSGNGSSNSKPKPPSNPHVNEPPPNPAPPSPKAPEPPKRMDIEEVKTPETRHTDPNSNSDGSSCPTLGKPAPKHSFDPTTPVLMADGTAKAIEDVETGDEVVATNPETGEDTTQVVTDLHINLDRELTTLTVVPVAAVQAVGSAVAAGEGNGDRSTRGPTATLETTQNHPFWDVTTGSWVDAADLVAGRSVVTSNEGVQQLVVQVDNYIGAREMRDLTVANIHTYYVLAGNTPVLVHNNDGVPCGVDVSRSDAEISVMHNDSGSGMIATLDNDGILRLAVYRNGGSPLSGRQMFDMAMGHFGDRVRGIEGNWFRGTNLDGFNALTAGGHSLPAAAAQTWTGTQAARYGFSAVESVLTRGPTGAFSAVTALFRRP